MGKGKVLEGQRNPARQAAEALRKAAAEARARAGQGTTQQRLADIEARLAEIELRLGLGRVRPSATKGRAVEVKEEGT